MFSCLPTFSCKFYFDHCKWNASNTDKLRWGKQIAGERLCGKFHKWGLLSEAGEKIMTEFESSQAFWISHAKVGGCSQSETCRENHHIRTETTPNILCTMHNYSPTQFNNYKLCMFSEFQSTIFCFHFIKNSPQSFLISGSLLTRN